MIDVKKFKEQGYILIPNCISNTIIEDCKDVCLSIRNSNENISMWCRRIYWNASCY